MERRLEPGGLVILNLPSSTGVIFRTARLFEPAGVRRPLRAPLGKRAWTRPTSLTSIRTTCTHSWSDTLHCALCTRAACPPLAAWTMAPHRQYLVAVHQHRRLSHCLVCVVCARLVPAGYSVGDVSERSDARGCGGQSDTAIAAGRNACTQWTAAVVSSATVPQAVRREGLVRIDAWRSSVMERVLTTMSLRSLQWQAALPGHRYAPQNWEESGEDLRVITASGRVGFNYRVNGDLVFTAGRTHSFSPAISRQQDGS